ncbi:MAG: helix-turn-helix domain-containing protein [Clostridiales bacterium]|nr:helix-turn-helix domain-containing protein [Clostridiales bacterium]
MFSLSYPQSAPTYEEAALAEQSYLDWERSEYEGVVQYVWRRRNISLAAVARSVIDEQLTRAEQAVIKKYWFEGKNCAQIAGEQGINRSNVTRSLNRAMEKLERYLKYVVMYQQSQKKIRVLPLAVNQALTAAAVAEQKGETAGRRVCRLRQGECLSLSQLAFGTGIRKDRLEKIEEDKAELSAGELIRLAKFFNVSADELLFGEKKN